jgi:chemotaxis protein methyltransferase CheR
MITNHEFEFTDASFDRIRQFILKHTGIVLGVKKKNMVYGRLVRQIRSGEYSCFKSFCDALESGNEMVQDYVINAMTTNLTAFFRENYHFDYLVNTVIPELLERKQASKKLRIWSAGCSTGEEPYSIAMTLKEHLPDFEKWDIKILASDLDANVIAKAKAGIYQSDHLTGISDKQLSHWFKRGRDEKSNYVKINTEVKDLICFRRLNLLHEWPMTGEFDFIFCRNVVIYFDKETQRNLFDRYANVLAAEGYLFLGHSETLNNISERFDFHGKTIYKKKV